MVLEEEVDSEGNDRYYYCRLGVVWRGCVWYERR